jgi:hypothetical protein
MAIKKMIHVLNSEVGPKWQTEFYELQNKGESVDQSVINCYNKFIKDGKKVYR